MTEDTLARLEKIAFKEKRKAQGQFIIALIVSIIALIVSALACVLAVVLFCPCCTAFLIIPMLFVGLSLGLISLYKVGTLNLPAIDLYMAIASISLAILGFAAAVFHYTTWGWPSYSFW